MLHQVGFITHLYRDARPTKDKIQGWLMIHSTSWGFDSSFQELYTTWCGITWLKTLTACGFRPLIRVCHIARRYNEEIRDRQVSYCDRFEDFFGYMSVLSRLFHVFMFVLSLLSRIQELTEVHTATNGRHHHVFVSGPALILWGLSSFVSYLGRCSARWAQERTLLSSSSP
jgi:hypothetical protein